MKIGQPFNRLTFKEYFFYIPQHKKYTDFNTLGLYRSILENEKLTLEQKIEVRDYANQFFGKFFDFLQVKDPYTHQALNTLGQVFTPKESLRLRCGWWEKQQKILKSKKIKHQNIGVYSKHDCGNPDCFMHGLMTKAGSWVSTYGDFWIGESTTRLNASAKSKARKSDRKQAKQQLRNLLEGLDEPNDPANSEQTK